MNLNNEITYAKSLENISMYNDTNYYSKCIILVRYWRTIGKSTEFIRSELYKRLCEVYRDFGENFVNADEENILNIATAKGLLHESIIKFSKEELDYIHSFNQLGFEKFLFIMFCGYKLSDNNNMFSIKYKEVMRLANNTYSKKYCTSLLRKSYQNEIFNMRNFYNNLMYFPTDKTLLLYNPNNITLEINNFKNIVYYYLEYIGQGKYIRCKECGCIEKLKTNNQLYCGECAKKNIREYDRNRKKK